MLEFRLFGQFVVRLNGQPLVIPSRLAQSLLAYLLLNRATTHRREKLAGLFWPDTGEKNARRSLRQELWRLRQVLDGSSSASNSELLLSDDLTVGLDPRVAYWLDVAVMEATTAPGKTADERIGCLEVYKGELLPDFYDDWASLERERLGALFDQETGRLLDLLVEEKRWGIVLEWGERWITLGHSPEPAYRALMVAHDAMGNRSQVAAAFQRCAAALGRDLGVEPSEKTLLLFEQLSRGQLPRAPLTPLTTMLPSTFVGAQEVGPNIEKPPYKGLHYFDEADADLFFGRERLVARLISHLAEHHVLTVVGASGSGKSSLVRAGLIPALKALKPRIVGNLPTDGCREWEIHVLTPTSHPLEALAVALTRGAPSLLTTTTLIDDLGRDSRTLRIFSQKSSNAASRLLLVIDQFEELFTLCRDDDERRLFVDNLLKATAPELERPIDLVVALRADFYAHCARYPNLRDALAQRQEFIGPMSRDELRRAIEVPAQRSSWELEPGLVDLLLQEVGDEPGALPLLSHALLETWKHKRGRQLTLEGYASCGGVRGAIAHTAESIYQQLTPEQQVMAQNIFLCLTELGEGTPDTRRRIALSELLSGIGAASNLEPLVRKLADARLITVTENTAEVAHEALIREWSRLREWLAQNREGLRIHRHLSVAAQAWRKLDHDEGELYRGARLAQALEWAKTREEDLNLLEREFLDASKQRVEREEEEREAQRQREVTGARKLAEAERRRANILRRTITGATVLLVVTIGLAIFAFSQRTAAESARVEAVAQRDTAESERQQAEDERRIAFTRELSVNAVNNLEIDPERSILLALQAVAVSSVDGKPVLREAEEALHRAVQASRVQFTLRGHTAGLWDIAFSPDGKRLATASIDGTAKVWDAATGRELLTLCCHSAIVYSIAFSSDGTRLATGSWDKTAKVWDAVTGQEILNLRGHTDFIRGIAFSPDGTRLATASIDKTARVWDARTGQELLTLTGHIGGVSNIAYSPDGKRLATSSWSDEQEHTAKVWDAISGKLLLTLSGHTSTIYDIAFSPDGKRVATAGDDGTAKIWDSAAGQLLLTLFPRGSVMSIAFSPDRQMTRVVTGSSDGTAQMWDATTGELLVSLAGHSGLISAVSISPDGKYLATSSQDATAKLWDISLAGSREWLTLGGHNLTPYSVAYSDDGRRIATASADRTVKLWDAVTGQEFLTLSGHTDSVGGVAFSPDGNRLVTVGADQTARVWDISTAPNALVGTNIELLSLSTQSFSYPVGMHVAYSSDGRRIATAGAGATAVIWDTATGQPLLTLCCHASSYVRGVAYSPNGARLATAGFDRMAKVWDLATGKELFSLSGHTAGLWAVAYSHNGQRIATASNDGTAKIWDAVNGKELFTLSGDSGSVFDVVFSPDDTRVATANGNGTVKVWVVSSASGRSAQPLTFYNPHTAPVIGLAFSPDGKRLASVARDGTRVYALPLEDIVAIARSRMTRTLTNDECQKFLHMATCPLP